MKRASTLVILLIAISHVTSRCLSTHPGAPSDPWCPSAPAALCLHSVLSTRPAPPAHHSLTTSVRVHVSPSGIGKGPTVFSPPGCLYLLFPSYLQKLHCFLYLNCSGPGSKLEPQPVTLPEKRPHLLLRPHQQSGPHQLLPVYPILSHKLIFSLLYFLTSYHP